MQATRLNGQHRSKLSEIRKAYANGKASNLPAVDQVNLSYARQGAS